MYVPPPPPPPPLHPGVVVGFGSPTYTTSESFRSVSVDVLVVNGILRRPVLVSVTTQDGTALGRDGESVYE